MIVTDREINCTGNWSGMLVPDNSDFTLIGWTDNQILVDGEKYGKTIFTLGSTMIYNYGDDISGAYGFDTHDCGYDNVCFIKLRVNMYDKNEQLIFTKSLLSGNDKIVDDEFMLSLYDRRFEHNGKMFSGLTQLNNTFNISFKEIFGDNEPEYYTGYIVEIQVEMSNLRNMPHFHALISKFNFSTSVTENSIDTEPGTIIEGDPRFAIVPLSINKQKLGVSRELMTDEEGRYFIKDYDGNNVSATSRNQDRSIDLYEKDKYTDNHMIFGNSNWKSLTTFHRYSDEEDGTKFWDYWYDEKNKGMHFKNKVAMPDRRWRYFYFENVKLNISDLNRYIINLDMECLSGVCSFQLSLSFYDKDCKYMQYTELDVIRDTIKPEMGTKQYSQTVSGKYVYVPTDLKFNDRARYFYPFISFYGCDEEFDVIVRRISVTTLNKDLENLLPLKNLYFSIDASNPLFKGNKIDDSNAFSGKAMTATNTSTTSRVLIGEFETDVLKYCYYSMFFRVKTNVLSIEKLLYVSIQQKDSNGNWQGLAEYNLGTDIILSLNEYRNIYTHFKYVYSDPKYKNQLRFQFWINPATSNNPNVNINIDYVTIMPVTEGVFTI